MAPEAPIALDNALRRALPAATREIKWASCGRAIVSVATVVVLAVATGNVMWLQAGIVAISSHIAAERTRLTLLGIVLHGAAIVAGFSLLFFSQQIPLLFVVCCGLFGAGTIFLTARGEKLRSLGNFTFIPSLYAAVELGDGLAHQDFIPTALAFYPYVAAAMLPVLVVKCLHQWWPWQDAQPLEAKEALRDRRKRWRIFQTDDEGPPVANYRESMLAVGIGVGIAALMVEMRGLHFGEWVIWSAASVVTGNLATSSTKVRDRVVGVLAGVPAGVAISYVLPHNTLAYSLAVLGVMLTLVTFQTYVIAFAIRCGLVTLAVLLSGSTKAVDWERLANVLLGSLIGIMAVCAVHLMVKLKQAGSPAASPADLE